MKLTLTTNHAASSYGVPVLVDAEGNAYGPADRLETGELAKDFVLRAKLGQLKLERINEGAAPSFAERLDVDDPQLDPVDVLRPENDRYLDKFLA